MINEDTGTFDIHILDIQSDDIPNKEEGLNSVDEFNITIYGKTNDDKNVVCNITGFKPYFYVKVPESWTRDYFNKIFLNPTFKYDTTLNINSKYYPCKVEKAIHNIDFYGYEWDHVNECQKKYKFFKLTFNNYRSFSKYKYEIVKVFKKLISSKKNKSKIQEWVDICSEECDSNLYEANIHPIIRFIHETNIKPSGWIRIKTKRGGKRKKAIIETNSDNQTFKCDYEINCGIENIEPIDNDNMSNLVIASFDIECDSLTGEFPRAIKDFKSLSTEIYDTYIEWLKMLDMDLDVDIKKEYIRSLVLSAFQKDGEHSDNITYVDIINGPVSEESIDNLQFLNDAFVKNMDSSIEKKSRNAMINKIHIFLDSGLVNESGRDIIIKSDPIIQIGTVFYHMGTGKYERHIQVIKPDEDKGEICDSLDEYDIIVEPCESEEELLLRWKDLINEKNPDFITGYNIFGFDFNYIEERIKYLYKKDTKKNKHLYKDFYNLGRINTKSSNYLRDKPNYKGVYEPNHYSKICKLINKNLTSSALGSNDLKYINMDGRVLFDVVKEVQKGHNLESYKLDNVSSHFMRGNILQSEHGQLEKKRKYCSWIDGDNDYKVFIFKTNTIGHLKKGDYITINVHSNIGETLLLNGMKFKLLDDPNIDNKHIQVIIPINIVISKEIEKYKPHKIEWCMNKDDVPPQEIFRLHKEGGATGRAKVAKYCIMDCELCIHLINLLDIIPNNIGMSNVCYVPFSYIFLRGQGIKVTSFVSKACNEYNTRMPTLRGSNDDSGFEGAVVLDPKTGIYEEDPIVVLDYASLYPSSIIENNFSQDKYVTDIAYMDYLKTKPALNPELNIMNYDKEKTYTKYDEDIETIQYDDYKMEKKGVTIKKIKTGDKVTCNFIKNKKDEKGNIIPSSQGIIPLVLQSVLDARKATRKRMKEPGVTESKKKVLDGLQLAYKVTANSVYGQLGARTSTIYMKKIAACTTSVGRQRIDDAENGVKDWAKDRGYEEPDIIYGDTDSVFIKFSRKDLNGNILKGDELLKHCIRCGIEAGEFVDATLRKPQNLEYEKTFFPFILISKKRYIGDKYEWEKDVDNKNFKRTSMGIVMKRRDNAPIVKYVFGHIIEKIMVDHNFKEALLWLKKTLIDINNGIFPMSYFIISKSLRADYKNPKGVAHKVLADRIAERDPGNKPKSNDRIPYAYIDIIDYDIVFDRDNQYKSGKNKGKDKKRSILQGNRIEHPEYIENKTLTIDYGFYITNQIMNPVKQVLDLNISTLDENNTIFEEYLETDKELYEKMDKYK